MQIALAICFQVQSLQDQVLKQITGVPDAILVRPRLLRAHAQRSSPHPNADAQLPLLARPRSAQNKLKSNTKIAGYILIAASGFLLVSLVLVFLQACSLDRGFDESKYDDAESLLGKSSKKADRFSALAGDDSGTPSAKDRYREKHGSYYAKYGIGGK